VDSPFNSRALRIQQPGKLLPDRANYEIFDDQRRLVAIAAETEAHTRRQVLSKSMSDARVLAITTSGNELVLTLIKLLSRVHRRGSGPGPHAHRGHGDRA